MSVGAVPLLLRHCAGSSQQVRLAALGTASELAKLSLLPPGAAQLSSQQFTFAVRAARLAGCKLASQMHTIYCSCLTGCSLVMLGLHLQRQRPSSQPWSARWLQTSAALLPASWLSWWPCAAATAPSWTLESCR